MARGVSVISGTDGLGEDPSMVVAWLLLAGVAGFIFVSTLRIRGRA